ncbi:MAG: PEGA domain-containing protein [Terriglobales bacterium]
MTAKHIGRFEVLRQIADTSLGEVSKALDPATSRHVIIRILRAGSSPHLLPFQLACLRQAMALDSPNIARVLEVGELGEDFYVVSEYVEGTTVSALLARGEISVWELVDVARQCCTAIDHAASREVAHWNLSPRNVMQEWDGTIKVMDYGLVLDPVERARLTGICDSVRYASPEQLAGEMPSARSNLFSLGAILYELACGRSAFSAADLPSLLDAVAGASPQPVHLIKSALQPALSNVISKALAKAPADRFQTGAEMITALDESLKPEPMPRIVPQPAPAPPVAPPAPVEETQAPKIGTPAGPQPAASVDSDTPPASRGAVTDSTPAPGLSPAPPAEITVPASETPSAPPEFLVVESRFSPAATPPPQSKAVKRTAPQRAQAPVIPPRLWLYAAAAVLLLALGIAVGLSFRAEQPAPSAAQTGPTNPAAPESEPPVTAIDVAPEVQPARRPKKPPQPLPVAAPVITTGDVFIDSLPQGATIQIDGRGAPELVTPHTAVGLEAGAHSITVTKHGYTPESRVVQVLPGSKVTLAISLTELKATLLVGSDPPGATVFIDGADTGKITPFEIALQKGTHTVLLRKVGFFDEARTLELVAGQSSRFSTRLLPMGNADGVRPVSKFKRIFGGGPKTGAKLKVVTSPKGAQVRLNQRTLDALTPAEFIVPAGIYEITLTLPGYKPVQKRVSLVDGSESLMNEPLSPAP